MVRYDRTVQLTPPILFILKKWQASGIDNPLDANAKKSADGRTLVLNVVNPTGQPAAADPVLGRWLDDRETASKAPFFGCKIQSKCLA